MKVHRNKFLKRLTEVVQKIVPDSEMYLFGSRATKKSNKLSDWDLLVLLNKEQLTFDFETFLMDEFYEIELESGQVISPLIYTIKEWNEKYKSTLLFEVIKQEGLRLI
jgi:predicted nucleotidyltransferase